jgi:hypothetical protein
MAMDTVSASVKRPVHPPLAVDIEVIVTPVIS